MILLIEMIIYNFGYKLISLILETRYTQEKFTEANQ